MLQGDAADEAKAETRATIAHVLDQSYAMLHPFMPFLTEELWAIKGAEGPARAGALALGPWPAAEGFGDAEAEDEIGWVVELIEAIRSIRSEMGIAQNAPLRLALVAPSAKVEAYLQRWRPTLERLARIEGVDVSAEPPPSSIPILVRDSLAALPLAGLVDFAVERARLEKEIAGANAEIAKIDVKLANADFVARAPEEIVEENRERREAFLARAAKLQAARERLEKL